MIPRDFISKWRECTLTERSAAQSYFNDLCAMIGEPTPTDADPDGNWFTFEKGARKTGGGDGWADVWKRGHFAWEMKGKHRNLNDAFSQLQRYAIALENPPLLVVSDFETVIVHTNFTNTVEEVRTLTLDDLESEESRRLLKWVFTDPNQLKPGTTRQALTEEAAGAFAEVAERLRGRGHEPHRVAHFLNKLLFCMFAEDIGILPAHLFARILETATRRPDRFLVMAADLFAAMKDGGSFGADFIDWFNGGLFDDADVLELDSRDLRDVLRIAHLDWSAIEPSLFGTLFERGLDPSKRNQLGAHYTDTRSIMRIVQPVVLDPLIAEWEQTKGEVRRLQEQSQQAKSRPVATRVYNEAKQKYRDFLGRLVEFRVLDPACGSGNFLYLALTGLKDLEHRVMLEGEEMGMEAWFPRLDPENVMGIELNSYAAELARVTVWIGQIQWMLRHGFGLSRNPVLKKLDQITCSDALLNEDGTEAMWPRANCIVGNPPFLGDKKMISELGEQYAGRLREVYDGRVPGAADLVTYWFEKAREQVASGHTERAGLVATNSIRGGANRRVLDRIRETGQILQAWSDEEWVLEGANVRVSLVCFAGRDTDQQASLDGRPVQEIFSDLTASSQAEGGGDFTKARTVPENAGLCYQGIKKVGSFDVDGDIARRWLQLPSNPNGSANREVLRPYYNGLCVTRRAEHRWIVDFGCDMPLAEAALYETPFQHVLQHVKPTRQLVRREGHRKYWWRFGESRPAMRKALRPLRRYIATPEVSKHRIFVWLPVEVLPDGTLFAIAREDDVTFGILHSRFHESWSLRQGTSQIGR